MVPTVQSGCNPEVTEDLRSAMISVMSGRQSLFVHCFKRLTRNEVKMLLVFEELLTLKSQSGREIFNFQVFEFFEYIYSF